MRIRLLHYTRRDDKITNYPHLCDYTTRIETSLIFILNVIFSLIIHNRIHCRTYTAEHTWQVMKPNSHEPVDNPNVLFVLTYEHAPKIHCKVGKLFICDSNRNSISTGTRVGLGKFSHTDGKKFAEFMQAVTDKVPGVEVSFYDCVGLESLCDCTCTNAPDPEMLIGAFVTMQIRKHFCVRYKFMEGPRHYMEDITYIVNEALVQRLDKLRRWFSDYDLRDEIECAENTPVEQVVFVRT